MTLHVRVLPRDRVLFEVSGCSFRRGWSPRLQRELNRNRAGDSALPRSPKRIAKLSGRPRQLLQSITATDESVDGLGRGSSTRRRRPFVIFAMPSRVYVSGHVVAYNSIANAEGLTQLPRGERRCPGIYDHAACSFAIDATGGQFIQRTDAEDDWQVLCLQETALDQRRLRPTSRRSRPQPRLHSDRSRRGICINPRASLREHAANRLSPSGIIRRRASPTCQLRAPIRGQARRSGLRVSRQAPPTGISVRIRSRSSPTGL